MEPAHALQRAGVRRSARAAQHEPVTVGPELAEKVRQRAERARSGALLSKIGRRTFARALSVLLPRLLVMIPALIAAVASMVLAVVGHQEMDDRNRRLCSSGVVVGMAATLLKLLPQP